MEMKFMLNVSWFVYYMNVKVMVKIIVALCEWREVIDKVDETLILVDLDFTDSDKPSSISGITLNLFDTKLQQHGKFIIAFLYSWNINVGIK